MRRRTDRSVASCVGRTDGRLYFLVFFFCSRPHDRGLKAKRSKTLAIARKRWSNIVCRLLAVAHVYDSGVYEGARWLGFVHPATVEANSVFSLAPWLVHMIDFRASAHPHIRTYFKRQVAVFFVPLCVQQKETVQYWNTKQNKLIKLRCYQEGKAFSAVCIVCAGVLVCWCQCILNRDACKCFFATATTAHHLVVFWRPQISTEQNNVHRAIWFRMKTNHKNSISWPRSLDYYYSAALT